MNVAIVFRSLPLYYGVFINTKPTFGPADTALCKNQSGYSAINMAPELTTL